VDATASFNILDGFAIRAGYGMIKTKSSSDLNDYAGWSTSKIWWKQDVSLDVRKMGFGVAVQWPTGSDVSVILSGERFYANARLLFDHRWGEIYDWDPAVWGDNTMQYKVSSTLAQSRWGSQAGVGFVVRLFSFLSVTVDAEYRSLVFDDLKGEATISEPQILYDPIVPPPPPQNAVLAEGTHYWGLGLVPSTDPGVPVERGMNLLGYTWPENRKRATLDLSSFGMRVGFTINLW
jgi:hypothetical protein